MLSDHAEPKLQHEERRLGALLAELERAERRQRRHIAEQETFLEELRAFRERSPGLRPFGSPATTTG